MEKCDYFTKRRGSLFVFVTFYLLIQQRSLALLTGNKITERPTFNARLHSKGNENDKGLTDLEETIRQVESQQKKIDLLLEALGSKNEKEDDSNSVSTSFDNQISPKASVQNEVQIASSPLKVMLFIDGTWLYYSLHEREDSLCPIIQRYGKGWQFKYNFDWGALPGVVCKAMQEQDLNQGWSTMQTIDKENAVRPIEVVRVLVFTSYKADTAKHSFRYQMFQDMLNAKYDVHMMETVGKGEKCIDIQLAVDMLHYATVPNSYDTAVLLSGDKDFMPAMVRTRQKGRRVGLASMRRGCNRALRETSNIKDYDVIFLEDHLDELIKPRTVRETRKQKPNLSQYTLMRIVSDFIAKSGMARVSSRDIGKYAKSLMVGNRCLLDEVKEIYGGLYQFLIVSDIFLVDSGKNKAFWAALRDNAYIKIEEEGQQTKFTTSEREFFDEYSLDMLGSEKENFYWHTVHEDSDSHSIESLASGSRMEVVSMPDTLTSSNYPTFTVLKLKEVCRERNLPVSGRKDDLINRIEKDIAKKSKDQTSLSLEEIEPHDHLIGLILEYLQVKGGQASSRDVGRYLAANKSSPKYKTESGTRISALTELKESSGSLRQFVVQSDSLDVGGKVEGGDSFEFLICQK
jgi:uncharacterized LabA/DUF88 family protein